MIPIQTFTTLAGETTLTWDMEILLPHYHTNNPNTNPLLQAINFSHLTKTTNRFLQDKPFPKQNLKLPNKTNHLNISWNKWLPT